MTTIDRYVYACSLDGYGQAGKNITVIWFMDASSNTFPVFVAELANTVLMSAELSTAK